MTEDNYLTIETPSEGIYREKGSKFLAFAHPVKTEEEIKELLSEYRKKYYDSRHVCYGYILGPDKTVYKAQDDGEPAHTAGDPILNEIKSAGVTDTIVMVIRYFGGTKLGKSGLISAYREAAADALRNAEIVEKTVTESLNLAYDYPSTNEVLSLINSVDAEIVNQTFTATCTAEIAVPKSKVEEAKEKLDSYLK